MRILGKYTVAEVSVNNADSGKTYCRGAEVSGKLSHPNGSISVKVAPPPGVSERSSRPL